VIVVHVLAFVAGILAAFFLGGAFLRRGAYLATGVSALFLALSVVVFSLTIPDGLS
jgi:hypothetical protein